MVYYYYISIITFAKNVNLLFYITLQYKTLKM